MQRSDPNLPASPRIHRCEVSHIASPDKVKTFWPWDQIATEDTHEGAGNSLTGWTPILAINRACISIKHETIMIPPLKPAWLASAAQTTVHRHTDAHRRPEFRVAFADCLQVFFCCLYIFPIFVGFSAEMMMLMMMLLMNMRMTQVITKVDKIFNVLLRKLKSSTPIQCS